MIQSKIELININAKPLEKTMLKFIIGPLQLEVTWYKIQNI